VGEAEEGTRRWERRHGEKGERQEKREDGVSEFGV